MDSPTIDELTSKVFDDSEQDITDVGKAGWVAGDISPTVDTICKSNYAQDTEEKDFTTPTTSKAVKRKRLRKRGKKRVLSTELQAHCEKNNDDIACESSVPDEVLHDISRAMNNNLDTIQTSWRYPGNICDNKLSAVTTSDHASIAPATADISPPILQDTKHMKRNSNSDWQDKDDVSAAFERSESSSVVKTPNNELPCSSKISQNTVASSIMSDSDASEDLPDMLGTPSIKADTDLQKGDLIWLKYKSYPFWPAIVRFIYRRKNRITKITVAFIVGPRHKVKHNNLCVSYKKDHVYAFGSCGYETQNKLKEQGLSRSLSSSLREQFRDAFEEAEAFLFVHKDQGVSHYFSRIFNPGEDDWISNASSDVPFTSSGQNSDVYIEVDDESEKEKAESEAESTDKPDNISDSPIYSAATKKKIEKRHKQHEKIVEFIKGKATEEHLQKIVEGTISCDRHKLFYQRNKNKGERNKLKYAGYGPIVDFKQKDEIVEVVRRHYMRSKSGKMEYEMIDYCLSVLVPEAIIFALQKMNKKAKSRKKAEEAFNDGPHYFDEETNHMSKEMQQKRQRLSSHQMSSDSDTA